MELLEERVEELELRVRHLEREIEAMRKAQKEEVRKISSDLTTAKASVSESSLPSEKGLKTPEPAPETRRSLTEKEREAMKLSVRRETSAPGGNREESFGTEANETVEKDSESLIGKYLIGGLASLLIFIAAASFLAMVWNQISPEVKLGAVSLAGLALTVTGFKMTRKKASNVSSILFGTGIGLVYISTLSANLVFGLVSHQVSAMLCVVWTGLILLSHRFTGLYFTIMIAGIGSFINLLFELDYARTSGDMLLVIAYTAMVSLILLYMSGTLGKVRYSISIFFSYFNFILIFIKMIRIFEPGFPLEQAVTVVIMLLLTNLLYRLANKENLYFTYCILTVISTLSLATHLYLEIQRAFGWTAMQVSVLFFLIILSQFVLNHVLYPNIEFPLSLLCTVPLYLASMHIHAEIFHVSGLGAWLILVLYVLRKKLWKRAIVTPFMLILLLLDFGISFNKNTKWTLFFTIINLLLVLYILYEEKIKDLIYKNVAITMILAFYFKISYDVTTLTGWRESVWGIQNVLAFAAGVLTVTAVYKIGYLSVKDETKSKGESHIGIYVYLTLYYFFGMQQVFSAELLVLRFIIMLLTLSVALFQSYLLVSDYEKIPDHVGLWLVAKYFIFTWTMMRAFLELPAESVLYSVVGLVLAVGAIYAGFKLSVKVIRQFGLAVTMLMVAKFIFVDLQGENSIKRVLAFALGGVLCFLISVIYNRLSKE